ncbi:hypothetical protein A6R68_22680 [Neotoma lepida]|uniref:Uncharacterized protein n=1 Tax=Neotoma lepida TaxID=56216 RepID=A0A1A6HYM9_NEOLE|nr:hypothetical protein A6R68_22680 [Neotoma lepida]
MKQKSSPQALNVGALIDCTQSWILEETQKCASYIAASESGSRMFIPTELKSQAQFHQTSGKAYIPGKDCALLPSETNNVMLALGHVPSFSIKYSKEAVRTTLGWTKPAHHRIPSFSTDAPPNRRYAQKKG